MPASVRAFEPWMLSNLVSGAVMGSFLVLLIPPFITDVTGSPARAGVVFGVMSLAALTGPYWGRIADRLRLHRLVYTASFVGIATGFAIFAVDDAHQTYSPVAGILLGASMAGKASVGSGMIVGSGLPEATQARQLTVFNLLVFGGQIIGALLVAALTLAGIGIRGQFWIVSVILLAAAVLTGLSTGTPQARMRSLGAEPLDTTTVNAVVADSDPAHASVRPPSAQPVSLGRMLRSPFGVLLAVVLLGGLCLSVLTSQIANIMPAVFGVGQTATSLLVAGAGVLGVPAVLLTGAWMVRSGPGPALILSVAARGVGLATLALLSLIAGGPVVAVAAAITYLAVAVSSSLQRSPMPRVATLLSPAGAAEANGLVGAAGALGGFIGCLAAGFIAQVASFTAVLWLSGVCGLLGVLVMAPMHRGIARAWAATRAD